MALDVSPYVDLTLDESTTQDLVDTALADAAAKWPDWQPLEAEVEVELIETLALIVTELTYRLNRLPGAVVETLLRLFGLIRDPGAPAEALVTFTTSNTTPIVIPAGTRLRYAVGDASLDFLLDVDVAVAAGAGSSVPSAATAETASSLANGVAAGTPLIVVDALAYVDSATFELTSAGRDVETDTAFLDRGIIRLRRLVDTLVLPDHFTAAALEDARVARAFTIDNYDPAVGPPGDNLGHVTEVVLGPAGVPLSAPDKTDLEGILEAQAHAGLDVHVIDATITDVDVDVTITLAQAGTDAATIAAVEAALDGYLDPDVWPFGGTVYRNELISLVDRVPGVDRVVDLTITGADVDGNLALAGDGPLANLGAPTVTVA